MVIVVAFMSVVMVVAPLCVIASGALRSAAIQPDPKWSSWIASVVPPSQ